MLLHARPQVRVSGALQQPSSVSLRPKLPSQSLRPHAPRTPVLLRGVARRLGVRCYTTENGGKPAPKFPGRPSAGAADESAGMEEELRQLHLKMKAQEDAEVARMAAIGKKHFGDGKNSAGLSEEEQDAQDQAEFSRVTKEVLNLMSPAQRKKVEKLDPLAEDFPIHLMRIMDDTQDELLGEVSKMPPEMQKEVHKTKKALDGEELTPNPRANLTKAKDLKQSLALTGPKDMPKSGMDMDDDTFEQLGKVLPKEFKGMTEDEWAQLFARTIGDPNSMTDADVEKGKLVDMMMQSSHSMAAKAGESGFTEDEINDALKRVGPKASMADLEKLADEMIAGQSVADKFSEQLKDVHGMSAKNMKGSTRPHLEQEFAQKMTEAGETLRFDGKGSDAFRMSHEEMNEELRKRGMGKFADSVTEQADLAKNGDIDDMVKSFLTEKPPTMSREELHAASRAYAEKEGPAAMRNLEKELEEQTKQSQAPLEVKMTVQKFPIPEMERDEVTAQRVREFSEMKDIEEPLPPRGKSAFKPKLRTKF